MILKKFQIPAGAPIPEEEQGLGPSAELVDFEPELLRPADVIGRRVDEVTAHAGSYGMGGPGFFGLRLDETWLIVALWGAADWLQLEGRPLHDSYYHSSGRPTPWLSNHGDELTPLLVGRSIKSIEVNRTSMKIVFDNEMALSIDEDSSTRPVSRGTGAPKVFDADEDLRTAVFMSPTDEIWV